MPLPPYATGHLDVGDGQSIYWEQSGNPSGKPLVMLHGGPGGAPRSGHPGACDPDVYRVIRFHQRGCGQSTPHAGDLDTDLSVNTTQHLVGDLEALREHLGIERWLVQGGSWGVTLGLAYAQAHPDRVTEALFVSVALTRPADVRWLAHDVRRFFPEQWRRFRDGVPADGRDDLAGAYDRLLNHSGDSKRRVQAAVDWCAWEDAIISLDDHPYTGSRTQSLRNTICFARLTTHYFSNAAFLGEDELLDGARRLGDIPAVLVHGRFDLAGPPDAAYELAEAWPGCELHLVRSGHTGNDEMTDVIRRTYARWAP